MEPVKLPRSFLLGTATAAVQIEGGDTNNSWFRWCEAGKIKDGSHCRIAVDHWNRVDEDVALLEDLGCQSYRMGIEWARLESEEGRFNEAAIEHYRDELDKLKAAGIRPLVTLHHFSNPLWFEDSGSWLSSEAPDRFAAYVDFAVGNLGDLVSDWITINEPNVYLAFSYLKGLWPPGHQNMGEYFTGARRMIQAHALAYSKIHELRRAKGFEDTQVGVAHHLRVFDPASSSPLDHLVALIYKRLFQDIFVEPMTTGRELFPLHSGIKKAPCADFLGINYYTRDLMRFVWDPMSGFGRQEVKAGVPVNDFGWEIYPEGLTRLCKEYAKYGIPLYITENGIADSADTRRAQFIHDHLRELKALIDAGVDIQRYYHWSLLDNFEWIEGNSARFGLVAVDYGTFKRTIRESGRYFASLSSIRRKK